MAVSEEEEVLAISSVFVMLAGDCQIKSGDMPLPL